MKLIIINIILIFFITTDIQATKNHGNVELLIPESKKPEGLWGKEAGEFDAFKDIKVLEELSEESSQLKLEEARKFFNQSVSGFKLTEALISRKKKVFETEVNLEDRYKWQKKAREANREKELQKITIDGRQDAIVFLIRAMSYVDKIENPVLKESDIYLDLKSSIYREYIKHQFAMKNFSLSIDMLERYLALGKKFESESEPHKLLAVCLEKQEVQAARYKKDSLVYAIRSKKNEHLLRYAELVYGKESKQFEKVSEKIARD